MGGEAMEDESVAVDNDDACNDMVGVDGGIGSLRAAAASNKDPQQRPLWNKANGRRVVGGCAWTAAAAAVVVVARNHRNDALLVVVVFGRACQLQAEAAAVTINVTSSKPIPVQQLRQRWRPIVVRIFDIFRKRFL
jgi:hypothetical protein